MTYLCIILMNTVGFSIPLGRPADFVFLCLCINMLDYGFFLFFFLSSTHTPIKLSYRFAVRRVVILLLFRCHFYRLSRTIDLRAGM